jgi:hypothetical protein
MQIKKPALLLRVPTLFERLSALLLYSKRIEFTNSHIEPQFQLADYQIKPER